MDKYLNFASHVWISCNWCPHKVLWSVRELYEKCPGALTYGDFKGRLLCKCGSKGWANFTAAGR